MTTNNNYYILPFKFKTFKDKKLIVNELGDFYFLDHYYFNKLINKKLNNNEKVFLDLKSKNFIADEDIIQAIEMSATRYRTRKKYLYHFTSLHMMVITYKCNHQCEYCQVASEDTYAHKLDMKPDTAKKIIDYIFMSPSPYIKIEFQGGEPILNWKCVKVAVEYAEQKNKKYKKELQFVLCTNLTLIDIEKLEYIKKHNIAISTSLDGPKDIHDSHRKMRNGDSSYDHFIEKFNLAKYILGIEKISALMTMNRSSLNNIKKVIDEYIALGFMGIFFRSLNPYGFAAEKRDIISYTTDQFIDTFREGLEYILELNKNNTFFVEYYTTLLLSRILTPFSTGFVDLQSPSGAGISGVIYDYNGDVYPADEARMLARMGDKHFYMGNVFENGYIEIFKGKTISDIVNKSCLEIYPVCSDCPYMPYCGADPIRNYLEYGDEIGKRPGSSFCQKHKALFDLLFEYFYDNNTDKLDIFWSWITQRSIREIKHEKIEGAFT